MRAERSARPPLPAGALTTAAAQVGAGARLHSAYAALEQNSGLDGAWPGMPLVFERKATAPALKHAELRWLALSLIKRGFAGLILYCIRAPELCVSKKQRRI